MKASNEWFKLVVQHVFSQEGLDKTLDYLKSFDYNLLKNPDLSVRKKALFCFFLLIGRPRLPLPAAHLPKLGSKSKLFGAKPVTMVPALIKEDKLFFMPGFITEEDSTFQFEVVRSIKSTSLMMGGHLFAYCTPGLSVSSSIGAIDLGMLKADLKLENLITSLPDPLKVRVFASYSKDWNRITDLIYVRVGGGEEDLPSCSTSCSQLSESSVDSLAEQKKVKLRISTLQTKASLSDHGHVEILPKCPTTKDLVERSKAEFHVPKIVVGQKSETCQTKIPSVEFRPKKVATNFRLKIVNPQFLTGSTMTPVPEKGPEKPKVSTQSPKKTSSFVISHMSLKKSTSTIGLKPILSQKTELGSMERSLGAVNPQPVGVAAPATTERTQKTNTTYTKPARGLNIRSITVK